MTGDSDIFLTLAIAGGIFLLLVTGYFLLMGTTEQRRIHNRASKVRMRWSKDLSTQEIESLKRRDSQEPKTFTERILKSLPSIRYLQRRLDRTGLGMQVSRYILLNFVLILLVVLILKGLFDMNLLLAGLIGIVIGVGVPHWVAGYFIRKRTTTFLALFPEGIDLIVRGLRSGLPIQEGIKVVSQEVKDPLGSEFGEISHAIKLGVTLEKALHEAAQRLRIIEFDFFVTSIALQRETGGNLAEILDNLSETIRGRHMMRLKIKAMSSEARASALIVGLLPFGVTLALYVMNPEYLDPLVYDFRGNIAAAVAIGSLSFGVWVMQRMAKFDI